MYSLLLIIIYLAFISLGLPDSLIGSAWPVMRVDLSADLSSAGIITMIIACGTVVSSLLSDALTRRLGTGVVTAVSTALTAAALLGFSFATAFWQLCLIAVPYGFGAGIIAVGAVLVALPVGADWVSLAGFVVIGLGCAPIYPSIIHATPYNFGKDNSQSVIGVEMASAYVGIIAMPPLFGVIAQHASIGFLPLYIGVLAVVMTVCLELLNRQVRRNKETA